jgi:hypothetical protein
MRVMLTGDFTHRDFRQAVAWLEAHAEVKTAHDWLQAAAHLERGESPPRLIVIAQSRPGQFNSSQVERLHRAAPLSRIVALLGSWCEGEARSGEPWPGVERVYWHQWPARMSSLLSSDGIAMPAEWHLPRTATAAERLLATQLPRADASPVHRGLVAIRTPRQLDYAALADVCRNAGLASVWLAPHDARRIDGVDVLLWDGAAGDANEAASLRSLIASLCNSSQPAISTIALLSFPRSEDVDRIRTASACAVLSKPFLIGELHRELVRRLPEPASISVA